MNTQNEINRKIESGCVFMTLDKAKKYLKKEFNLTLKLNGSYVNRLNPGRSWNAYFSKIESDDKFSFSNVKGYWYNNASEAQKESLKKFRLETLIVYNNKIVEL